MPQALAGVTPMPLQNRVTPFGDIVATPYRGLFTGNRGIIHNPLTRTLLGRRWTTKAWLICVCEFKGRRRQVMATRSWTELFFLDEATALAAGHRPCFFCRRADAAAFREAWARGQGIPPPQASAMDEVLHRERWGGGERRLHELPDGGAGLPDGTMVQAGGDSFLVAGGRVLPWSFAGYLAPVTMPRHALLLTPPSTVGALRAGYRPVLHPSVALATQSIAALQ